MFFKSDQSQWIVKDSKLESNATILNETNHSSKCESDVKLFINGISIVWFDDSPHFEFDIAHIHSKSLTVA